MNRRELIKAILPVAAIPVVLSESVRAEGICEEDANWNCYKLEKGANYLFVFRYSSVSSPERVVQNLKHLGVTGVVHFTRDEPEDAVRIYRVDK